MTDKSNVEAVDSFVAKFGQLKKEIAKKIIGQEKVIDEVLISVFSGGHSLLVGVPGLAKTLLVNTIAKALGLSFSRIQFTPDLMPSDIIGSEILNDQRQFQFIKGPLFANIILADEINRTPPKTQSALLEAMQEKAVTVAGERHTLQDPFFVLATQNPIEQEGTYPSGHKEQYGGGGRIDYGVQLFIFSPRSIQIGHILVNKGPNHNLGSYIKELRQDPFVIGFVGK